MAIGDTLNQNPFGTNFNPEDEEEKRARLAAQGAMMGAGSPTVVGAGNIPASAFGQAPAVAPFSMEAAGQLNPMMQPQSLEVTPQAPTEQAIQTTADNSARTGRYQQRQGELDQREPAVTTTANENGFFSPGGFGYEYLGGRLGENIGEFAGQQKYGTGITADGQATGFPVDRPSLTGDLLTLPGTALNLVGDFVTDPLIAGGELAKDVASYATGATGVQEQQDAQAARAALALEATQGVTPPVETPSEGAQGQGQSIQQGAPGSAQANFATRIATGEALTPQEIQDAQAFAASMGTTFDPATGYSREAFENAQTTQAQASTAPAGGLTTVGGASLSEFLSGQAMPEQGFTQAARPLGGRGVTLTPDQMNELSAQREARLDARPDFGEAVSDRDRRAARGDDISMADQTSMAKANSRDATPTEVARGNQVANALGVDLETGQPLQATGGLTFDQVMKMEDFNFKQGQETYKREQDALVAQGKATEAFEQDSSLLRQVSGDAGRIGRLTNEAIGLATEPGTTALSGSLLKHVAGSDANQLKSILAVISSKVALDRLMEVKKTGATLGQVSEKELAMLQNSFDALDQSLPPERLREALTNYANQLKKVEDQTQRAFIDKHGQDKFNKIMGGGSMGQGEPRYSNDQNVGVSADTYYKPSK